MSRTIKIKDHRIVEPLNKAEQQTIYPVKDGVYEAEDDMPITCGRCGAEIPEIGVFPENWRWGSGEDLCPDCLAKVGRRNQNH